MNIISDELIEVQTKIVNRIVEELKKSEEGPVLFFYSGGSALGLLDEVAQLSKGVDLSHVIFAPVDERKDISNSNARALYAQNTFGVLKDLGVTFIDLGDLNRNLDEVADEYDKQTKLLVDDIHEHDGKIISLFGMGSDGHTAGIFPYPDDSEFFVNKFIETERYVVGYDVGTKNPYKERITLTVPALIESDTCFVYVVGDDKKNALTKVMEEGNESEIPARLWKRLSDVTIFTDIVLD